MKFHTILAISFALLAASFPIAQTARAQSRQCVPVAEKKSAAEPWAIYCANAICDGPPVCEFIWFETDAGDDAITCGCDGIADECCHVTLVTCSGCGATYPQAVGDCDVQQSTCQSGNMCVAETSFPYPRLAFGSCTTIN